MSNYYILDGKVPVECQDVTEWAKVFENGNRRVASTERGEISVSTVFLGIDHSYGRGEPALFETMIFGGEHDEDTWRYATWKEAEEGHKKACNLVGVMAE